MKVAIIGCGIGGMASAIRLARMNHDVTVFEAFETAKPLGAGLLLQPSGLEALEVLGLRNEIESRGAQIDALKGKTPTGRLIMDLRYQYARPGEVGVGIHRATLFDALFSAMTAENIKLETGRQVILIENEDAPILHFADGERAGPFDLVIISDGAHSCLRGYVCPTALAPQYPWGAVWSILPDASGRWHDQRILAQIYAGTRIMIGVLPAGENPADPSGPKCISFFWSLKSKDFADWKAAGLDSFKNDVAQYWPEAGELLSPLGSLDGFATAAYRDVRCSRWSKGKIVLIGDAAHGASPQLGQGANMALIDANALADAFSDTSTTTALGRYETSRRPTIRYYTWMSWALTPLFQGDANWIGWIRDQVFGLMCRLPGIRNLMSWTLVGRGRWFW